MRKTKFVLVMVLALTLFNCETMQQTGTLVGAGTGAALGGLATAGSGHHHGWGWADL